MQLELDYTNIKKDLGPHLTSIKELIFNLDSEQLCSIAYKNQGAD